MAKLTGATIHWQGTQEQEIAERMKACRERRAEWGENCCEEKDGSCSECEYDMAVALRVTDAGRAALEAGHD